MKKRSSINVFKSVILALMIRETQTRFIDSKFSYMWAIIDPASQIIIMSLIFSFFNKTGMIHGIPIPLFLLSGILPWMTFTNIMTKGMNGPASNLNLFVYKNVKPIDTIISRTIIEIVVFVLTYFTLLFILSLFGYNVEIKDVHLLFLSFMSMFLLSFSLAIFFASISVNVPEIKKLIPMIMKPIYFISGIFFSITIIPEKYRDLVMLNPIINIIENIRYAMFDGIAENSGSLSYVVVCSIYILFFGLVFYIKNEKNMIMSR